MCTTAEFRTRPLRPGYAWTVTLVDGSPDPLLPLFPVGGMYKADVKAGGQGPVLVSLTSAAGNFTRIDDSNLVVTLLPAQTLLLPPGKLAVWDIVRTDVSPDEHLDIEISVPITASITNPTE